MYISEQKWKSKKKKWELVFYLHRHVVLCFSPLLLTCHWPHDCHIQMALPTKWQLPGILVQLENYTNVFSIPHCIMCSSQSLTHDHAIMIIFSLFLLQSTNIGSLWLILKNRVYTCSMCEVPWEWLCCDLVLYAI